MDVGPEVLVLGPVEVRGPEGLRHPGGPRQRAMLAMLALNAGQVVSNGELAEAIWGEDAVDRSKGTMQVYASNLRRVLGVGSDAIEARSGGYRLDPELVAIDATRFAGLVEDARISARRGDASGAAAILGDALALWRGDVAADLLDVDTLRGSRDALHELRRTVEEDRFDAQLGAGNHVELVPELVAACQAQPLRERRWAQCMLALYRSGRQGEALQVYQQARDVLGEELGVEPGAALRRLEAAVLRQSESLLVPATAPGPAVAWLDGDGVAGRQVLHPSLSPVAVGRDVDRCTIAFSWDPRASRHHADLILQNLVWHVVDAGSQNGTYVNGERVGSSPLADGDSLRIGDTTMLVCLGHAPTRSQPHQGKTLLADDSG